MSEVWMIKWDNIPHLFSSLGVAKQSIMQTYPDHLIVGSGSESEHSAIFDVCKDGKIQDRVTALEMSVHSEPITIPTTVGRSTAEF